MTCIFCDAENNAISIEHIVSESLGNEKYVMQRGKVCDICNSRFSKFEGKALTKTVFAVERARFAIRTKKKKAVKGKIKGIEIEGDKEFRKTYLYVKGLTHENFKSYDPKTKIGSFEVSSFDKSEVATSKLVLKIALESIFTSQKKLFKKYDFKNLKDFLTTKNNMVWPFMTTDFEIEKFKSVPIQYDKYLLNKNHCELKFLELNHDVLLFKFKYGGVALTLNLLNRNVEWTKSIIEHDKLASFYPDSKVSIKEDNKQIDDLPVLAHISSK